VARPAWPDGPWRPQDLDGLAYFSPGNVQGKNLFNLDLRSTASVARPAWPTGPWRLQDLDGHGIVYLTGRCGSWPHLNVVLHLRSQPAWLVQRGQRPRRLQDLVGHAIVYLTGRAALGPHLHVVLHSDGAPQPAWLVQRGQRVLGGLKAHKSFKNRAWPLTRAAEQHSDVAKNNNVTNVSQVFTFLLFFFPNLNNLN
jgi:hypothetical protein